MGANDISASSQSKEDIYKEEQIKRLSKFVINEMDTVGYKIEKILAKGDEYVIYEVSGLPAQESIRVYVDTIVEEDKAPIERFNKIKPDFDEFLSILFKYDCDVSYKKRASSALTMAINGDLEGAQALFKNIKNDAQQEHLEKMKARLSYLSGSILLVFVLIILSIFSYYIRATSLFINNIEFFNLLFASTFASLGGFLSISLKIRSVVVDRGLGKIAYFLYGAERIIISIIGGVFIFILIKGDLIFGFIGDGKSQIYAIMAFCLLAGFSETLVPNTLKNLEKSPDKSNE